ncbi:MAG: creatininase family protein [Planctomycetes bacterium]|nr:creatininase family protein [Planctomycetota bacterium]
MKPKSIHWGEHPWDEIKQIAESGAVVVAPFGSTEQHGPMLPVDTDIRIAEKSAVDGATVAAEKHGVPVLVAPTMPFGLAPHHMKFAGTITLQPETYVTLVAEVLSCIVQHGFRRIAVISGHGGNMPGLQLGIKKVVCQSANPVRIALYQGWQDAEFARRRREAFKDVPSEGQIGIHAARSETSGTLADRPHLVRKEKAVKPTLKVEKVPEWSWLTDELSETGAFGDPSMADADLGRTQWEIKAEAVGLFIKRLWETDLPD